MDFPFPVEDMQGNTTGLGLVFVQAIEEKRIWLLSAFVQAMEEKLES
jgi:hypothetical protein